MFLEKIYKALVDIHQKQKTVSSQPVEKHDTPEV